MKLYFVRHGKTEWNLEGRYQGATGDSPLLPQSYKELNQTGMHLRPIKFSHIYSSPLGRARKTAFIIQEHLKNNTPVSLDSRLEEFHLGTMEGQKFTDIEKEHPKEIDDFRNHPGDYDPTPISGETFESVIKRMRSKINEIVKSSKPDDNVLIVGHGAALTAIINSLAGASIKDLRNRGGIANGSTSVIETNDNGKTYKLLEYNDTSYLKRKPKKSDLV